MADAMAFTKLPGGFSPTPRFHALVESGFVNGAVYWLTAEPERSDKTHAHEFAWITEAWKTLPDALSDEYPTSEHLRKRALIRTGWCTIQDYVCGNKAETERWARNLRRELDEYAVVVPSETVVRVFRAKSQSRKAMGAADFQKSKTDILNWIADLIGVAPADLQRAQAA